MKQSLHGIKISVRLSRWVYQMEIWPPMADRVSESQGETARRTHCKKGGQGCAALCWWTTENENKHKNRKKTPHGSECSLRKHYGLNHNSVSNWNVFLNLQTHQVKKQTTFYSLKMSDLSNFTFVCHRMVQCGKVRNNERVCVGKYRPISLNN